MSKYAQNLQKSDAQKASEVVSYQETQAKAAVDLNKASIGGQLARVSQKIENLKSQFPLDVNAILTAQDDKVRLEGYLSSLEDLSVELFS